MTDPDLDQFMRDTEHLREEAIDAQIAAEPDPEARRVLLANRSTILAEYRRRVRETNELEAAKRQGLN